MKTCIYCKKSKPLTDYCRKAENKDGHDNRCRSCMSEYKRTGVKPGRRARIEVCPYSMAPWPPRLSRIKDVHLRETPGGEWLLHINGGEPLPASDVEVTLWLRIENLQARLSQVTTS